MEGNDRNRETTTAEALMIKHQELAKQYQDLRSIMIKMQKKDQSHLDRTIQLISTTEAQHRELQKQHRELKDQYARIEGAQERLEAQMNEMRMMFAHAMERPHAQPIVERAVNQNPQRIAIPNNQELRIVFAVPLLSAFVFILTQPTWLTGVAFLVVAVFSFFNRELRTYYPSLPEVPRFM